MSVRSELDMRQVGWSSMSCDFLTKLASIQVVIIYLVIAVRVVVDVICTLLGILVVQSYRK